MKNMTYRICCSNTLTLLDIKIYRITRILDYNIELANDLI